MSVISAVSCAKNCTPNLRTFSPPAYVTVTRYRTVRVVLPVESVCVDCGTVLAPADLAAAKYRADPSEVVSTLREQRAARLKRQDVHGKTGSFRDLGLPTWMQQPQPAPRLAENVRNEKIQSQEQTTRLASIQHALGLVPDHPEIVVQTPAGPVTVTSNLAKKILSRTDSGHNQLLHVGLGTLRGPREIWEDGDKWRFLGLYSIGSTYATHMAVAHRSGEFVYTIYEIDDSGPGGNRNSIEERTNAKRRGTCLFVAYLD